MVRIGIRPTVLASTRGMARGDWLELRRLGIGGSDAAVVIGASRYKSRVELWAEKTGRDPGREAGLAARVGLFVEPLIVEIFKEETGAHTHRLAAILRHPDHPWMIADVDRVVKMPDGRTGILDMKTVSAYKAREWDGGDVPPEYYCQIQHYLAVTGYRVGWLAALINNSVFKVAEVPRDDDFIANLIAAEAQFWATVEIDEPPSLDGSDAATAYLATLFPRSSGAEVSLPAEASALAQEYADATAEAKAAAKRAAEAENRLKGMLGDAESGSAPGWTIRWSNVTQSRLDVGALREAHPEIAQEFTHESVSRRFTVRPAGDTAP